MLEAGELVVLAGEDAGAVERARGGGVERVDREARLARARDAGDARSEEHTSELQSLMRTSYAVFCSQKINTNDERYAQKNKNHSHTNTHLIAKMHTQHRQHYQPS